jgi:hypothetical protein
MGGEEENNQRGGGHDLHENLRMHYTAMQQQPDVLCSPSPSSLLVDLCIAVFFPSSYSLICCRFLSRALSLSLGMDSQAFQEHILKSVLIACGTCFSLLGIILLLVPIHWRVDPVPSTEIGNGTKCKTCSCFAFLGSTILLSFDHCLWARVTQQLQPVL